MSGLFGKFLPLALAAAAPALAQDPEAASRAGAQQIGTLTAGPGPVAEEEQLSSVPARSRERSEAPGQFGDPAEPNSRLPQLSPAGDRETSPQLYRGGRSAQPLPGLSQPAQGRVVATEALAGEDRCDPRADRDGNSERCRDVIETRSAQFARPDPVTLSPEQRLLIEERNRPVAGAQAAAQRLATNAADPDELQDQAVASQVLRSGEPVRPAQSETEEPATLSQEVQSFVQALVNSLTQPQ